MTEHTISLPESIYRGLLAAAQARGLSPAKWIALQLAPETDEPQSSTQLSEDLVGAINSKAEPIHRSHTEVDRYSQPLSELLAGLTGKIDSKAEPHYSHESDRTHKDDAFGESFIAEMAKQGIHLP